MMYIGVFLKIDIKGLWIPAGTGEVITLPNGNDKSGNDI
jgi:hypothetical protein